MNEIITKCLIESLLVMQLAEISRIKQLEIKNRILEIKNRILESRNIKFFDLIFNPQRCNYCHYLMKVEYNEDLYDRKFHKVIWLCEKCKSVIIKTEKEYIDF